jgi:tricorn protease
MFIERLSRKVLSYWKSRQGPVGRTPTAMIHGPMVCLANEFAGSGGDAFPYYFRKEGLGPIIGDTTWGGLVGISRGISLADGGSVTIPEFGFINTDGDWDVENVGVAPDIPVDQTPGLMSVGRDPQLERGIEEILRLLEANPPHEPSTPPFPVKR